MVKCGCFKKLVQWRAQIFCRNEGAVSGDLYQHNFVGDLLESQNLFEILQTSLTFKNNENVVKSGFFEKLLQMESANFFSEMK